MDTLEECLVAALGTLDSAFLARFVANPLEAMRNDLDLNVTEAPHLTERRTDGGACDGMSFVNDGVILFAPSPTSKRQNFTLAHELGHWVLPRVPEVFDWLSDQSEPKRAVETLCDMIAQHLLLPKAAIDSVIARGPVQAEHIVSLFKSGQASLPVCAIALAQRIPGLGAVVVTRPDLTTGNPVVEYANVRPDPMEGWPAVYPWPAQAVPPGHPIKSVRKANGIRQKTTWSMPWGKSADFYMDAIATDDGRVVTVLSANDIWGVEKFHPATPREFDQRLSREVTCCGASRQARGFPCATCRTIACPECGYCRHQKQDNALVQCTGCWVSYSPNLLVEGRCEECR